MPRVAIVIVTYNSALEIGACLDALTGLSDVEIVVVDNASADGTVAEVRRRGVPLIVSPKNSGFAGGVNKGVRDTTAPLVLLLNPDAIYESGIDALAAEFDDARVGAAGGMLTDARGVPQAGFTVRNLPGPGVLMLETLGLNALFPNNFLNWHYRCSGIDLLQSAIVEQPAGAFLMFPRQVWENLAGFDERFWPVWFEDVDFCARVRQAGLMVKYNPAARARHAGAHSVGTLSLEIRERYWYGSLLEYASKHFTPTANVGVCLATLLGVCPRAVRAFPRHGKKAFVVYGAVGRLAVVRLSRVVFKSFRGVFYFRGVF
jgi:GT2 family glycosyltransferase